MSPRIAALEFIGNSLARDTHAGMIEMLRARSTSGKVSWKWVVWLANQYLVSPALYGALRDKGLLDALPDDLCRYLTKLHQLNSARNQRLKDQTCEAIGALNGVGIEPLLLKGAAHLFTDTFQDPGARVMTDLDLLVPEGKFANALATLRRLSYRSDAPAYQHYGRFHHAPPLFRPGDYGTLELHRHPLPAHLAQLLPNQALWSDAEVLEDKGLRLRILGPTSRVLLNVIHSQILDRHHAERIIELRQLHDFVVTCHAHQDQVDWVVIAKPLQQHGKGPVLDAYLYLAHRLFAMALPDGRQPTRAAIIHYRRALRQLRWLWFALEWIPRFGRFGHALSADAIRGRYGDDGRLGAITRGRLQFLAYMLKKHRLKET